MPDKPELPRSIEKTIWQPIILYLFFIGIYIAILSFNPQTSDLYARLSALFPLVIGVNAYFMSYPYFMHQQINKYGNIHLLASAIFLTISLLTYIGLYSFLVMLVIYLKPWYHHPKRCISCLIGLYLLLSLMTVGINILNSLSYWMYLYPSLIVIILLCAYVMHRKFKNSWLKTLYTAPYRTLLWPMSIYSLMIIAALLLFSPDMIPDQP